MSIRVALSALLVFGFFLVGCKATRPVPERGPVVPVGVDTVRVEVIGPRDTAAVVAIFRDTAVAAITFVDAQTFQLRSAGQRDALRAALRRERELWRASGPRDYQFLLRVDCFCPGRRGWLLIEARRGQPLRAWDRAGKSAPLSDWNTFGIDALFDMLDRAADMDGVVQVAFDPRWHFPANVRTVRLPGPDMWTIIDARGLRQLTGRR